MTFVCFFFLGLHKVNKKTCKIAKGAVFTLKAVSHFFSHSVSAHSQLRKGQCQDYVQPIKKGSLEEDPPGPWALVLWDLGEFTVWIFWKIIIYCLNFPPFLKVVVGANKSRTPCWLLTTVLVLSKRRSFMFDTVFYLNDKKLSFLLWQNLKWQKIII